MIDFDLVQCSHELWSWLSLTLGKSAQANRTFHKVDELNVAEVYRRLIVPTTSTSVLHRNALRGRAQNHRQAKSMASIMDIADKWGWSRIAYGKAGGKPHDKEEP